MSMYFIRHGETIWNKLEKVQGITDTELTEKGILQAKRAAISAESFNLDVVISSPLKRALKTAEIISEHCNCKLVVEDDLIERNFGDFEGIEYKDISWKYFWSIDAEKDVNGIERCEEFLKRIENIIESIASTYKDKNVLIVSHGGFYKGLRNVGVDLDKINLSSEDLLENCQIVEISK